MLGIVRWASVYSRGRAGAGAQERATSSVAGGADGGQGALDFVTPQSLLSFPVASLAVGVIWQVLQRVFDLRADSAVGPFVVAMVVGATLYLLDVSSREKLTPKDYAVRGIVALINSFFLAASALGISVVANPPT